MTGAAISYMVPDSPQALRRMQQRLMEERFRVIEQLCNADGWDDFKERLGKVRGLETAVQLCAEVEKEMRN
jgi:hypothetical protein